MSGGAWGPQPHQTGNQAYFRSGAPAAKLLARVFFYGSGSMLTPDGTGWLSARAIGPGGNGHAQSGNAGGGGAFARTDQACLSGQNVVINLSGVASVSVAGMIICSADAGKNGVTANPGLGGQAANSIGSVKTSGGSGSAINGSTSAATNGGAGSSSANSFSVGGSSAGERNATDAILIGATGKYGMPPGAEVGFPGGGGAYDGSGSGASSGAPGIVCLEYWSAKP